MGIKRFQRNLEKFFYNPIALTKHTRKFFPNLRTQWIYEKEDEIFCDGQIQWYVVWYPITYMKSEEMKRKYKKEIPRKEACFS